MKILFEETLNNKQLGNVIDKWNEIYEYEFHVLPQGKFMRIDLQQPEESEVLTLENIIKFYKEQIENKLSYIPNNEGHSFREDLKLLNSVLK